MQWCHIFTYDCGLRVDHHVNVTYFQLIPGFLIQVWPTSSIHIRVGIWKHSLRGPRLDVSSIFWPSPSFRAPFSKLVKISSDRHLGAHLQCEQRAIAVGKRLQPLSPPPLIRMRSAIAKTCYFPIVVSDVVST